MLKSWSYWGRLEGKKAVYVTRDGEVSIEEDHRHLVEPTPEEKQQIYMTWPGLINERVPYLGVVVANWEQRVKDQQLTIEALRLEVQTRDIMVGELEKRCDGWAETSGALIEDLAKEKNINLRWEKFAHDTMKEQAELLRTLNEAGIQRGGE